MRVLEFRRDYPGTRGRATFDLSVLCLGLAACIAHNKAFGGFDEKITRAIAFAASLYVALCLIVYRGVHRRWGFTVHGSGTGCITVLFCLAPMLLSGTMMAVGLDIPRFSLQAGPYLAWCAVQDFVFFSFCARHAEDAFQHKLAGGLFAGILFGLSHLPFTDFAWVTFAAGTVWAWIFLKTGCIYPILAAHWILGIWVLTMR